MASRIDSRLRRAVLVRRSTSRQTSPQVESLESRQLLSAGKVYVGDPFVPDQAPTGPLAQFDALFGTVAAQTVPYFQPRRDYKRRVVGIHALSPVINRASRLQDTDKLAPGIIPYR